MAALHRLGVTPEVIRKIQKTHSASQEQTKEAFGFKWKKRNTYESEAMSKTHRKWLLERYCQNDPAQLDRWLEGDRKIILDAGCGSSWSAILFFGDHLKNHDYLGVDISSSVGVAEERFQERGYPGDFIQTSLLDLPIKDESLDIIFSEGVLHHTDSVESSIGYLTTKLKQGGLFLFYVYVKKA